MKGVLFIVGTPIGNLGDLAPRAQETLQTVDLILAEDTRHSGALCRHFGIRTPLRALHAHNEGAALAALLAELQAGKSMALISDAGMPLISDPGFPLVRACQAAAVPVRVVPGPSAVTAALAVAGLPCDRFAFEGFLPAKTAARTTRLESLVDDPRTLVFFEAPHRVAATLADCVTVFGGQREAALARELTKTFESVLRGTLAELLDWAQGEGPDRRGEFVLLIGPQAAVAEDAPLPAELRALAQALHGALPPRQLAKILAGAFGRKTAEVYALLGERPGPAPDA